MPTCESEAAGSRPRSRSSALARIERLWAASGSPSRAREALGGPRLDARQRLRVGVEEEVHRLLVLGAERRVAPVAVAAAGHRRVVGDVARGLLEVGGQPAALEQLGHHVRDPLAGDVGAAQLGHRVVAVAEEDALVELARPLALLAVEGGGHPASASPANSSRNRRPQRALVARVAREQGALDRLGQVHEREHGPVEVGEMGASGSRSSSVKVSTG